MIVQIFYSLFVFVYVFLKISRDAVLIIKEDVFFLGMIKCACLILLYPLSLITQQIKKNIFIPITVVLLTLIFLDFWNFFPYCKNFVYYLCSDYVSVLIGMSCWNFDVNKKTMFFFGPLGALFAALWSYMGFSSNIVLFILGLLAALSLYLPASEEKKEENFEFSLSTLNWALFFLSCSNGLFDCLIKDIVKKSCTTPESYKIFISQFWIFESLVSCILNCFLVRYLSSVFILPAFNILSTAALLFNPARYLSIFYVIVSKVLRRISFGPAKQELLVSEKERNGDAYWSKGGKCFSAFLVALLGCFVSKNILFIYGMTVFFLLLAISFLFLHLRILNSSRKV